jgi:cellulase
MKSTVFAVVAALSASRVAAHATFQELWINGVDQGQTCVRLPQSNSPLTDVSANSIRCNVNRGAVAGRCAVKAGDTVSVEMHQQDGDRSCTLSTLTPEAIGGAHWGPVHAYMSKVSDARTADGSTPFFKVFANTWAPANNGAVSIYRRDMNQRSLTNRLGRQRLVGCQRYAELLWTGYVYPKNPHLIPLALLTAYKWT